MENLVWGIIFIMEVMKYILAEKIFFKRDVKRKWAGFVGILIYICVISFAQITSEAEQHIIMYALALITAYIMVYQRKMEDFVHILILFIEVSCIEGITEKLIVFIVRSTGIHNLSTEYQLLITGIVVVFMLFTVYVICKRKRILVKRIRVEYIWILVIGMVANMLLTAAGVDVAKEYVKDNRLQGVMSITYICSYISVALLILFITYD